MGAAIRVENVGKRYRVPVGDARPAYRTLREAVGSAVGGGLRRLRAGAAERAAAEEFWALNDVSFEVQPGEVVGIIGRNGAGKSTLLKVLSRITRPTTGRIELNGRVGSLLEVGTGFHPELTGRENVYLNGSILGMSRVEVARKFDEIVAFAEVEKFLDTPVKRYSSGMYVRLAFAVAAHLEPEILIVDEVLAVGDATFQRRCLDRLAAIARRGQTILFVSHNMQVVPTLCRRAVHLRNGRVADLGPAQRVTDDYLAATVGTARDFDLRERARQGDGRARFQRASLVDSAGRETLQFLSGTDLTVRMAIEADCNAPDAALAVVVQTAHGNRFLTSWTREVSFPVGVTPGQHTFECRFRQVPLRPGHIVRIGLWMSDAEVLDSIDDALLVDVVGAEEHTGVSHNPDQGVVLCDYNWRRI